MDELPAAARIDGVTADDLFRRNKTENADIPRAGILHERVNRISVDSLFVDASDFNHALIAGND